MTTQEQQLLQELFQRLSQTRGAPKDAQAEALVRDGLAATPDAAYWLAQRTLVLENALQQAQQQITQLEHELEQARQTSSASGASSFLSGGLGTQFGRAPEPSYQAPAPAPVQTAQPAQPSSGWRDRFFGGSAPRAAAPAYAPAAPLAQSAPSAAGSFLGTAAASAAGVAGGMFLFNGLGNLLGGHHDAQTQHSNSLMEQNTSSDSSSHQSTSGDHGGIDQMAHDAGRDSVGQQSANSDWDDGGDFVDDDFA